MGKRNLKGFLGERVKQRTWVKALIAGLTLHAWVADAEVIDTWILSGQSNAEGYGITESPVDGLAPADTLDSIGRSDLNTVHTNVRFYRGTSVDDICTESADMAMAPFDSWHSMLPYEGLTFDWPWGKGQGKESGRRFGPELAFGYDMQQIHGGEIAIIKYARGSASIAPADNPKTNGDWNDYVTDNTPEPDEIVPNPVDTYINNYDHLLATIEEAAVALPAGDTLRIQGVLWMQGEADATDNRADDYKDNLAKFIEDLSDDISKIADANTDKIERAAASWDELKFFIGLIGGEHANDITVRTAMETVAAGSPNIYTVDAHTGISTMTSDDWLLGGLHYDTAGQVELGKRYAAAVTLSETGGNATPQIIVGGSVLNGDFNAYTGAKVDFANTANWYNLGGDQTVWATKDNIAYIDGSQNALLAGNKGFGLDTGHTISEGNSFDISYVWYDAHNWVDASDTVSVSLFVTLDDTITGERHDLKTKQSPISTQNSTYETVDQNKIYTADATYEGKTLFVAIETSSGGFARLDNFELIVTP